MSKHTPGPWLIAETDATFVYALNDEGCNRFIAHVQDAHTPADELKANARLISAAPELRRVAEMVVEAAKHKADKDWTMFHLAFDEAADVAAGTVAKALGT